MPSRLLVSLLAAVLVFAVAPAGAAGDAAVLDRSITQRVARAIADDPALREMDIKVKTRDGVVNLSGFVRSLDHIAMAGSLAQSIRGVTVVRNDLRLADQPSRG